MLNPEGGELARRVLGEVHSALGLSPASVRGRLVSWVARKPVQRFAQIAATCDRLILEKGFVAAGRWTLFQLASGLRVKGVEHVPDSGPVLIVSNHPGSVDALALVASSGREDLKIVAWPMPFLEYLPTVSHHLVYASDRGPARAAAARGGIRHLKSGGALLLFARGQPEPDPASMSGAESEILLWSRSIELFLRSVPEAAVVPAIVSGVLAPRFVWHPATWVVRGRLQRQRVAIVVQFISQMRGKRVSIIPSVEFGPPLAGGLLQDDPLPMVIASARSLLGRNAKTPDP